MARIWESFLADQDKAHLSASGERPPRGFGAKPAVLSIDNYRWAVGDEPEPLLDAITKWPGSAGPAAWRALPHIERLLAVARAASIPVVHITGLSTAESGVASWSRSRGGGASRNDPQMADRAARRFDIVEQAAPEPGRRCSARPRRVRSSAPR